MNSTICCTKRAWIACNVNAAVVQKYAFLMRLKTFDETRLVKQAYQLIRSTVGAAALLLINIYCIASIEGLHTAPPHGLSRSRGLVQALLGDFRVLRCGLWSFKCDSSWSAVPSKKRSPADLLGNTVGLHVQNHH